MHEHLAKRFHQQATAEWRAFGLPEEKDWPQEWHKVLFKTYPRFPQVPLLPPLPLTMSLEEALSKRKTCRSFDKEASISFAELSTILHFGAGIRPETRGNLEQSRRFHPSAGARYPLELYLCAERVEGLPRGLYHFNIRDNTLELMLGEEGCEAFKECMGYPWGKDASVMILTTSLWARNMAKYRDFGYKAICMEAGHQAQNFQLASEALKLSSASVIGFRERELDKILNLQASLETSIYATVLGRVKISSPENS